MTFGPSPKFLGLQNIGEVAKFFGTTPQVLQILLYRFKARSKYNKFGIAKKRGGIRLIEAPPPQLRFYQRMLADALLREYRPKLPVHGFVETRSIKSNADLHVRKRVVFNVDLQDFFGSIHIGRIIGILEAMPFSMSNAAATVIAQICCNVEGKLPQGAATSPILSNIVCRQLDEQLLSLAKAAGATYTRYADDITFSSTRPNLPELCEKRLKKWMPTKRFRQIVRENGFHVNYGKSKASFAGERQFATGLTVNESVNVPRRYIRDLETLLHIWAKYGESDATERYNLANAKAVPAGRLADVVCGKLAYLQMIKGLRDPVYTRLARDFREIALSKSLRIRAVAPESATPITGVYKSRSDWTKVISTYSHAVEFVQVWKPDGINSNATAFAIDSRTAVTAGHLIGLGELRLGFDQKNGPTPMSIYAVNVERGRDLAILRFAEDVFKGPFLQTECRIPCVGENVVAVGYPRLPDRDSALVTHHGIVEALPIGYTGALFVQTSFPSGGGLSGSPLLDKRGRVLGVMVENIAPKQEDITALQFVPKSYGQATPYAYVDEVLRAIRRRDVAALAELKVEVTP